MSETIISEIISLVTAFVVSGGTFGVVALYGTKFMRASRELIRKDIVKDYHTYKDKAEIEQWELESLEREYAGYNDMLPKETDAVIDKMMNDIRKWKIVQ